MISIQINCEPEDYEAHFALLGFMRQPPYPTPPYIAPETKEPTALELGAAIRQDEEQSTRRKPGRPKRQETAPPAADEQDAADEKAESDKNKPAELTHNDVREAISRYSKKHGAQAAVANIRAILGSSIEGVAATQENLAAAIAKIDAAAAAPLPKPEEKDETLFGLDASKTTEEEEPRAAKKEVNEAARLYGVKYDGTTDPKQMVHTAPDVRAILSEALNMKVIDFNSFPDEPLICGRAKAAIMKAIEENPFKREVKE